MYPGRISIDMGQISIRMDDERIADLDREAEEEGYGSRADLVRDVLESRNEPSEVHLEVDKCRDELSECQSELDELQTEVERLHRERRQLLEQREENKELVRYTQDRREIERRQREVKQHNVFKRAWWWVAGEPAPETNARGQ
jgi:predicted nuclease with TOPRIM domain